MINVRRKRCFIMIVVHSQFNDSLVLLLLFLYLFLFVMSDTIIILNIFV